MLNYNEEFDKLRAKVLRYALYKMRTIKEVREKFQDENIDYMEDIINFLIEDNYINEEEYVNAFFQDSINLRNQSIKEIRYKLINKGIDKHMIDKYIDNNYEELIDYEIRSAKILLEKRIDIEEEKNIKYLSNKGYSFDNIRKAISLIED